MTQEEIISAMAPSLEGRGCFMVEVTISKDNDILLVVESEKGIVDMDDCVALSEAFQALFDRDKEDYSLTVSSAGLDQPFKVPAQFTKAVGTQVEAMLKGGRKITGTLVDATPQAVTLAYTAKEAVPGKKKKETVSRQETFPLEEVNSVRPHITFE